MPVYKRKKCKTKDGSKRYYYYKQYKNGKKKIISKDEYNKKKKKIQKGGNIELTNYQIKLKKTLEDGIDILDKNNIPYMLAAGTALGAHRDKSFTPCDSINGDIDTCIFAWEYNDIKKIIEIFNKDDRFSLGPLYPTVNDLSCLPYTNKSVVEIRLIHNETKIYFDIFFIYDFNDGFYYFYTFNGICKEKENKRCKYKFRKFKKEQIEFLGKKYNTVPIQFLEDRYGKEKWKIPACYNYFEGLTKEKSPNLI